MVCRTLSDVHSSFAFAETVVVVACFSSYDSLCANISRGPLNFFKKGDLLLPYLLPGNQELNPDFSIPSKPPQLPCREMAFYKGNFTIFHPHLQEHSSVQD